MLNHLLGCCVALALALTVPADAPGEQPTEPAPDLRQWAQQRGADALAELQALEDDPAAQPDRIVPFVSRHDRRVGDLIALLDEFDSGAPPLPPDWLAESNLPEEARSAIVLHVAGELHAQRCYSAVLAWLTDIDAASHSAPHLIHYYRAVAHHQLVELEAAQEHAELLTEHADSAGRRHLAIAKLILRDAGKVEPEGHEHIARQMNDIRRRLNLGRSADAEVELQQQVIDALKKLIEQAEQQQQQQQQASSGGQSAPSTPMQDSQPAELKGPGEVERREIAAGGDWGSLPPAERQRVTQQIGRDFPGYYRDVIEAYFRSLANPEAADGATQEESP